MSSAVYFKFKASLKQYTIPFEGSAISVKDLRNAIKLQCGLKSSDFELEIHDKNGKEYSKDEELIPKFSDLVVRRLPKASDPPKKKIHNPEDMTRRDPYKAINSLPKLNPLSNSINLARANIPDDEKIDIMAKRISEEYSEKNYQVKSKPYGVPPPSYICNKCHQGGHWIHECPGLRDKDGRLLDFKTVKRPTGIPQDFLLEVQPGTPGAYLTKEGKYMVPIKDAEAYAYGKKEKRPFSIEENPPYIEKQEEIPKKFKCPLCKNLMTNPTITPCCRTTYCEKCIMDHLYDPEINGAGKCPKCQSSIEEHSLLEEDEYLRQLIQCWKAKLLTIDIVDRCVTTTAGQLKKTELTEDSSRSPDMKFDSANRDETVLKSINNTNGKEDKVFVNNRRVLKPKASLLTFSDGTKDGKNDLETVKEEASVKTAVSEGASSSTNDIDKVPIKSNTTKETDVNDLIFGKVEDNIELFKDLEQQSLKVTETKIETNRTDKATVNSSAAIDTNHSKIETIWKRSDLSRYDRKYDKPYQSNNRSDSTVQTTVPHPQQTPNRMNNNLANTIQAVTALLQNSNDGTSNHLINQYPTSNVVSNVQQQLITNALPINTLESFQWPLINSMYNNNPIPNVLNGVNPGVNNNWLNNSGLPINNVNSAASNSRILTKEEFYERQRQLRAQKLSSKYRNSRSPSGSLSPRRRRKSRENKHHRHHRTRSRNSKERKLSPYHHNQRNFHHSRRSSESKSSSHRRSYERPKREMKYPSETDPVTNKEYSNLELKDIDPKLVQDSISTFLKYLGDANEVNSSNCEFVTNHKSSNYKIEPLVSYDPPVKNRSHSRSPHNERRYDYDNFEDTQENQRNSASSERRVILKRDMDELSTLDVKYSFNESEKIKSKKSKKYKSKSGCDDEENTTKKKHKKHKKHKHKKAKKIKKEVDS